jgi:phosphatidylglycerol lysyltransferase
MSDGGDTETSAVARRTTTERVTEVLRTYPATIGLVVVVTVASVLTGALWNSSTDDPSLYERFGYGLPALRDGEVWTFLTGAFLTPQLALYAPVLVLLMLAAGTYERRVGHLRTILVVVFGQALAALVAAVVLLPFDDSGWTWAEELGRTRDLGLSAGGFAAVGALTAVMQPVWRTRVRWAVGAYLVAMVLNSGLLWDLEHLFGWALGMMAGPFLVGRSPRWPTWGFGIRTQRSVVALVVAVFAVANLVDAIAPGNGGPFHDGGSRHQPVGLSLGVVVLAVLWLVTADALRRGRRVAWVFTTVVTVLGALALLSGPDSAETRADLVLLGLQLVLLVVTFGAFTARSPEGSAKQALRRLGVVLMGLAVYTVVGFLLVADALEPSPDVSSVLDEFVSRVTFSGPDPFVATTTASRLFLDSIGAVWMAAVLLTFVGWMYRSRRTPAPPDQPDRLRSLLRSSSSTSSIEWMLTWDGTTVWFSADDATAIGYRVVGTVALCLGDPVGPPEHAVAALRDFDRYCLERGWTPCLFAASAPTAEAATAIGWTAVPVGEDAVVPLPDLEFKGKAWQDVRTALNKAGKQDVTLEVAAWSELPPALADQLRVISEGWVSDKALPEMGFTLGSLAEADDPDVRVHLAVDADRTVEGFTSWLPVARDGEVVGWTVDLMRRRDGGGFRPVTEFLIGASALQFKEEGYEFVSLSAAPLAHAPETLADDSDQRVLQALLDFLGDALEPYYGFRSLLAFKAKFQPTFAPIFLVFPDETALAEIGVAIARAYMPDATVGDWVRMAGELVGPAPVASR